MAMKEIKTTEDHINSKNRYALVQDRFFLFFFFFKHPRKPYSSPLLPLNKMTVVLVEQCVHCRLMCTVFLWFLSGLAPENCFYLLHYVSLHCPAVELMLRFGFIFYFLCVVGFSGCVRHYNISPYFKYADFIRNVSNMPAAAELLGHQK